MVDYSGWAGKIAVAGKTTIGPIIAALFLVPAAVILALYPMNWILGTVDFYTASIPIGPLRAVLIVPIILGFALAQWKRDWLLAAMLVPGIALMLFAPDRIGSHPSIRGTSEAFYPERYVAADVAARIKSVERSIEDAGWAFETLPPQTPSMDKVKSLQTAADQSTSAWKGGVTANQRKLALQQQIAQATGRRAQAAASPTGGAGIKFALRYVVERQRIIAAIDSEITQLTSQLNQLSAGAKADDLYSAAVSATAALKVELEGVERLVAEKVSFTKALPYIIAASLSFALFIFAVGFRSWATAGLVLMTALACLWSAWPVSLEDWQIELPPILYPAFICTLSAFVLRFAYRAYLDNSQLKQEFERSHLTRSAMRATLLWLPFPVIVVAVVYANNWLYSYASSAIYCEGATKPFCGSPTSEPPIRDSDPSRDTLRDDINAAIHRLLAKFEAEAIRGAQGASSNVAAQVSAATAQVMATFVRILPDNIYQIFPEMTPPPTCRWLLPDLKCFARKIALERLNAAYQAPRNRLKSRLETTLADVGNKVTTGVVKGADGFQKAIKGESEAAALYATKSVDATFVGFNALATFQMALMLIVSMRALLLIFGRMLYRHDAPTSRPGRGVPEFPCFPLTHSERRSAANERLAVRAYTDEFELSGDKFLPLLTKRRHNVDDADQATLLFRARYPTWPIRRLVNGCLILTEVTRLSGAKSIRYSTSVGGRQIIVWTIPAGGEVFFRWDRFVAMTSGMEVRKTISLRVGGLATGTTMQASVIGPGLLIQGSAGRVELTRNEEIPGAVFPSRLLSWEAGSQFRIKSPKRPTSVYFDPPSLAIEHGAQAVSDTGGDGPRGLGLLRELIRLFRP